ncbi:hypothetical protein SDC9_125116 [bioreactor metagenome]|uniref:Uncharacterized protein n=1 Tax=bioreactor metagenome TaxID=1076179 RepID=A0A645CMH6_9ZZZZ
MRKVKPHALAVLIRTGLMHVRAQHFAQCRLQQVGCRVVARRCHTQRAVNLRRQLRTGDQQAVLQGAGVHIKAFRRFFAALYPQGGLPAVQGADIAHLPAGFGIKRGTVQHDQHALFRAVVGRNRLHQLLPIRQCQHGGLCRQLAIADKFCRLGIQLGKQIAGPAGNIFFLAVLARGLPLLFHLGVELILIHLNARLGRNFFGQIQREAERILQT